MTMTIEDVFDDEVFNSNFWLYWRTMFAFENWHSALEMKLYFQRFIHHISGLPDFSALKFTKYNQYESLILPMQKYLEEAGVDFQFNTEVTNVVFDFKDGKKIASLLECRVNGVERESSFPKTTGIRHQRKLYGGHHLRRPEPCPQRRRRGPHQRLLEPLEKYRKAGSFLRPPGEILLRYLQNQLGIRHRHHAG